jgi:hypothetical protein
MNVNKLVHTRPWQVNKLVLRHHLYNQLDIFDVNDEEFELVLFQIDLLALFIVWKHVYLNLRAALVLTEASGHVPVMCHGLELPRIVKLEDTSVDVTWAPFLIFDTHPPQHVGIPQLFYSELIQIFDCRLMVLKIDFLVFNVVGTVSQVFALWACLVVAEHVRARISRKAHVMPSHDGVFTVVEG